MYAATARAWGRMLKALAGREGVCIAFPGEGYFVLRELKAGGPGVSAIQAGRIDGRGVASLVFSHRKRWSAAGLAWWTWEVSGSDLGMPMRN